MIYVMSDLHGEYALYQQMLEKIQFSEDDLLYVLGDVLDRGKEPIKILLDMMERSNVVFLAGNHERMALDCMNFLMREISDKSIQDVDLRTIEKLLNWQENGAQSTISAFRALDQETRQTIID